MAKKDTLIKKIKAIIEDYGAFNTGDVEATSSPVYTTMGKNSCALIEGFGNKNVGITMYIHETETGSDSAVYEDLAVDTLEEILELAEQWKEKNEN